MNNSNVIELKPPSLNQDPLTEMLRKGARDLIAKAVNAELEALLAQYSGDLVDGKQRIVRNGYLPERTIQTGIGDVEVKIPKVKDRHGAGVKFNSKWIPPYLKKTKSIEELLPVLYLKGISTGDFNEALRALLGDSAKGLICEYDQPLEERVGK